ncbi:hypothetical protein L280_02275 [Mannheimia haemolytica MhBrain2012]|nr:hypothetical protein MHH_c21990 [Mannheimia haemolytica M42548]AGQ24516.1 hypothetical protein F382_00200 [Mannheimia haemolytica D153]AGQ37623.1 hypothetical protein J450_00140 [Mannheimia haemolytica D171]AGQ40035.1 hypothetical protein J451_00170 [Mannheimia haemolytica D174]AGR75250.1 hypothetical protein N220_08020 [Mannheimia haemolytica USMARC_2286]EEY11271.1 hypothetical protein COI_0052 [Mannheimia haemolytica serotype A2 str. OVINE]EEY11739.1 hypothetical protein COK_2171 [Mannhe
MNFISYNFYFKAKHFAYKRLIFTNFLQFVREKQAKKKLNIKNVNYVTK